MNIQDVKIFMISRKTWSQFFTDLPVGWHNETRCQVEDKGKDKGKSSW